MDLILEIQNSYISKKVKYISNLEIENFLEKYKNQIFYENFSELKNFFLEENKLNRSVFKTWEEKNKNILIKKTGLVDDLISYHLEKDFIELLKLRKYSSKTIKNYSGAVRNASSWLQKNLNLKIENSSLNDLKEYFLFLTKENHSASSLRIKRFSIEYYFKEILQKSITLNFALKIRKRESLPTIFSKDEIKKILNSTNNLKHKMILSLLYSSGLRISEVVNLNVGDIDLIQNTIKVKMGKGNKDRFSVLSEKLNEDLKVFTEGRKQNSILFPSNQSDGDKESRLSARTIEQVFQQALKKSGIKKQGTPHDFRHSFATHLLESGTDIHFIQKLLGHKNLSTTSIYTKLANPKLAGVKSPL